MTAPLEQALGVGILLLFLLDVFLTVLYARIGTGLVSPWIARLVWRAMRGVAAPFGRRRGAVLAFCGPIILVAFVVVWTLGLTLGAALLIHPALGSGVRVSEGPTPTDFVAALYAGGTSLAITGSSEFSPQTSGWRLVYLFLSLVGTAVVSLTLTYLMQVYGALQRRNALGLQLHAQSGETADAAELLARLGPDGQFSGGYNNLSEVATQLTQVKEAHHHYPVLFYFRFQEPFYEVSRITLLALDTATLTGSALSDDEYGWLRRSAAVAQLRRVSLLLLTSLEENFVTHDSPGDAVQPDERTQARWRRRHADAVDRLRQAGIATVADEREGAASYVALRTEWDGHVAALAPAMLYDMEEIDPAGSRAGAAERRPDSPALRHPPGERVGR
ncbi:hypothetical protein [Roseisolibacter sp. H3M3-2]|uniref:hypothetical protein n=1 Tax=Roseisolibacter sp. H3M3-2 TaxID=3031323 RepID=UPI0023DC9A09|nr:hypothetical protein [Roseisolibacter sp. H3M3-2]MDF1502415.1 hypothetical protein [Roseisolibacter sp. H3M3-2]